MTVAQTIVPIIIFWAVIGGLGASLLLPSMQSLIHGNFQGEAQKQVYALVGASAAIAAAIGPLIGGIVTTFLSWRVGFLLELVIIVVVLSGLGWSRTCRTPAIGASTWSASVLSALGMGGIVLGILVWEDGSGGVLAFVVGRRHRAGLAWPGGCCARSAWASRR